MIGLDTYLPHTLVPLALAVSLVRSKLSARAAAVSSDSNGLARYIASAVPVYEYFDDPDWRPRRLTRACLDGVFRDGGAELRFVDGRRSKRRLAVRADDIECVIDMLNYPADRLQIRSRVLWSASAKIRRSSQIARTRAATLRAKSERARAESVRNRGEAAMGRGNLEHLP